MSLRQAGLSRYNAPNGNESGGLEFADEVAAKVLDADISVALFHCGDVHAVERNDSSWLDNTEEICDKECELVEEFIVVFRVSHVAVAVTVCVKGRERRGEDREVHGVFGKRGCDIHTIGVVDGEFFTAELTDDVHDASPFRNGGSSSSLDGL